MEDYQRIEKAIRFLMDRTGDQPTLQEVAHHIVLSPYHTQRLFKRWAGISPKQFTQYLTIAYAKKVLEDSGSTLEAAYGAGLSGTGRLHDLFVTIDAVTPGEFKTKGRNLSIHTGVHASPFGSCLLGVTERGLCWLSFFGDEGRARSLRELERQFAGADITEDSRITSEYHDRIFGQGIIRNGAPLTLFLKGTNFQLKVWEALLRLPSGRLISYERMAAAVGQPRAVRAVASAVARNPVSFIIPCHRVLRKSGLVSGYRWGPLRKKAMIAWEAARESSTSPLPRTSEEVR